MFERWRDILTPAVQRWLLRAAAAGYWVLLFMLTHTPGIGTGFNHPFHLLQQDKTAHITAFGLLCALLIAAWPARTRDRKAACGFLAAAAYCVIDEVTQSWTGRTVSTSDVLASFAGVLWVYLLVVAPTPASHATRQAIWERWKWWVATALCLGLIIGLTVTQAGRTWVQQQAATMSLNGYVALAGVRSVLTALLTWCVWLSFPRASGEAPRITLASLAADTWPRRAARLIHLPFRGGRLRVWCIFIAVGGLPILTEAMREYFLNTYGHARVIRHHAVGLVFATAVIALGYVRRAWRDREAKGAAAPSGHATSGGGGGFVGHARVFAMLTLLSRFTGLARDAVLASMFGLSAVSDAFFMGFLVPNLFRRLFGEGALSAAFIPHYTELLDRDPALARRFASAVLTALAVGLCIVTVVGEFGLYVLLSTMDPADKGALAVRLMMLMLPYMPLVCVVAMIGGVLQVHRKFGPPAAAPLVLNGMMILGAWWAVWQQGAGDEIGRAYVLAVSVVIAGLLQLAWQAWELRRLVRWTWSFAGTKTSLRSMLIMMGPMTIGLGVYQLNALLDSLIAFLLSPPTAAAGSPSGGGAAPAMLHLFGHAVAYPIDVGGVAAVQWSQRLYQFPLGVFGIAIATAVFPALAAAAAREGREREQARVLPDASQAARARTIEPSFGEILRQGLRLTVFIGLPAAVGLVVLRQPVVQLVYQRGAFTPADTQRVATVLGFYAMSIWAYSMTHVLTRAFYAYKDAKTPLRISLLCVALNFVMNLSLIWVLGVAGLALSTAISAVIQVLLLTRAIRKRVDQVVDRAVGSSWLATLGLSAAMAAVLWPLAFFVDTAGMSTLRLLVWLLAMMAIGGAVYAGGAWWWGCEEMHWLWRRRRRAETRG